MITWHVGWAWAVGIYFLYGLCHVMDIDGTWAMSPGGHPGAAEPVRLVRFWPDHFFGGIIIFIFEVIIFI